MTQTGTPAYAIQVQGLTKRYGLGAPALAGVDLGVRASEFVAVIGRSGAGKSTLLRCMNLLIRPTSGRVLVGGRDVTGAWGTSLREVRGRVGMIFQGFNLVRRMTVLDNVLTGRLRFCTGIRSAGSLVGWYPAREREAAFACLEKLGMGSFAMRRADALSGGQQQRVAIARALAQEPEVILADEPIASLDPRSAEIVMQTLREIHESRRIAVIVNLHQVEVARTYATRVVAMAGGKVHLDVAPAALNDAAAAAVYREQSAAAPAEPGWKIEVVTPQGVAVG